MENSNPIVAERPQSPDPPTSSICPAAQLLDKLLHLTLDGCKGVADFAQQIRLVRLGLLDLDKRNIIPEFLVICTFLVGLNSRFDDFLKWFLAKPEHSLVYDAEGNISKIAVTFDQVVRAALIEESYHKKEDWRRADLELFAAQRAGQPVCYYCPTLSPPKSGHGHTKYECLEIKAAKRRESELRHRRKNKVRAQRNQTKPN